MRTKVVALLDASPDADLGSRVNAEGELEEEEVEDEVAEEEESSRARPEPLLCASGTSILGALLLRMASSASTPRSARMRCAVTGKMSLAMSSLGGVWASCAASTGTSTQPLPLEAASIDGYEERE